MNMPATLMWARGFDMRPVRITFEPAAKGDWKAATQLFPTDGSLGVHRAQPPVPDGQPDRAERLHVFDPSRCAIRTAREYTIRTAVHHDGSDTAVDAYAAGVEKIVNEAAAVFGEFPNYETGTYTFLGDYVPWGGGDGMEHRNSTVVASATSFKNPEAVRAVLGTVAHEFFHCWNVERIRPKTLEPFNFEDANISGELWLAEGFTQYYGAVAHGSRRPVVRRPGCGPDRQRARDPQRTGPSVPLAGRNEPDGAVHRCRGCDRRNQFLEHVHLLLHLRCRHRDRSRLEPARPLRRQNHTRRLHARDVAGVWKAGRTGARDRGETVHAAGCARSPRGRLGRPCVCERLLRQVHRGPANRRTSPRSSPGPGWCCAAATRRRPGLAFWT